MATDKFKKKKVDLASVESFIGSSDDPTELVDISQNGVLFKSSPRGEKIHIGDRGLEFDDDVTLADIKEFAEKLKTVESAIQWMWGDLVIQCGVMAIEDADLKDIAILSGYTVETLYNFAGIARLFPPSDRGILPSFTHYKRFYEHDVDKRRLSSHMEMCAREGWSSRDLEYFLTTGKRPQKKVKPTLADRFSLKTEKQIATIERNFEKSDEQQKEVYAKIALSQMQRWAEAYTKMIGDED